MRRPHRTVRDRLQRRAAIFVRTRSPLARRRLRRIARTVGLDPARSEAAWKVAKGAAEVVDSYDAWQVASDLAADLCAVIVAAGIETVQLERHGQHILVAPLADRADVLAAIETSAEASGWWLSAQGGTPRPAASAHRVSGVEISVFRLLVTSDGDRVGGPDAAVQLQFWRRGDRRPRPDGGRFPEGTHVPPSRNRVTPYLTPTLWQQAQQHPHRLLLADALPQLLEVNTPVDVVYTWVDDSDPEWRRRRRSVAPDDSPLAADALDPARTTNRDELRYSLRSLAMYANWVRHIWLVTDGQVPSWLDLDHPRLSVVSHRDIFTDPANLPTFNSHAIESQLHHIDGLAEHFLYMNDDVFFGRPVRPELFFHGNGIAKFAISAVAIDRQIEPLALNGASLAARRNRKFLENTFGRTVTNRMQHVPHSHVRSSLADFEAEHPKLFRSVAASRFRSARDNSIASDLGHYYAYATGSAVTGGFAFRYVDIGSPRASEHLDGLLAGRDQDCFCLNDVGGYLTEVDAEQTIRFLRAYFPVPSPFEADAGR
jgi:hypothetical protein